MKKHYLLLLLAIAIVGCEPNEPYPGTGYVPEKAQPTANFTHTASGLTVKFTNQSKNASTYYWDFGDGKTSTEKNPTHTYKEAGTYIVALDAINGEKKNTQRKSVTVTVPTEVAVIGFRFDKVGLDGKYWTARLDDTGPVYISTWAEISPYRLYQSDTPKTIKFSSPIQLKNLSMHKTYTIYAHWSDKSNSGFTQRLKQTIYRDSELYRGYPTEITKKNNAGDTQVTLLLVWR